MTRKFPSDLEVEEMREKLSSGPASKLLSPGASDLDKLKSKLCMLFIEYKKNNRLSQKELAKIIGIDEALVSKILHYNFEKFTVDRLIKYLSVIHQHIDFDVKVDLSK